MKEVNGSSVFLGAAWAHFALLLAICSAETFTLIEGGFTVLPRSFESAAGAVRSKLSPPSVREEPLHSVQALAKTYLHLAGTSAGYGFFAPNVPNGYRLYFELHDQNGVTSTGMLAAGKGETGLRLASFLDSLGRTTPREIREILLRFVAESVMEGHLDAVAVRLSVEVIRMPTLREFEAGKGPSYEPVYSYDFRRNEPGPTLNP